MEEGFDKKWLAGLKFNSSKAKTVERDGRQIVTYEPTERPLREQDVLAWSDQGDEVELVTGDGRKLRVAKAKDQK
ncbi:hypothetical protein [Geoalkalibacter sp.]|uniref:hypothetical protein n=1 Tax=Geoalkalibacter sp. TaxID=3041440 RepID=UPI00272E4019|nr:hypothetical protein [Geoalkalibacter sp.]